MTRMDFQILENWACPAEYNAEIELGKLEDVLDRLTDAIKHRDGARSVRGNHQRMRDALRKFHDLFVETMPVTNGVAQ